MIDYSVFCYLKEGTVKNRHGATRTYTIKSSFDMYRESVRAFGRRESNSEATIAWNKRHPEYIKNYKLKKKLLTTI